MSYASASDAVFTHILNENTRILAIDDDPIQLEFASVYLATPTASVDIVENGAAGLKMLEDTPYDILLCDIDMPVMNGFDVVKAVRAHPKLKNLPIIVITGREDIVSIDTAYNVGATSFVTKPVNWRLLSYHVRYVLRANTQRFSV